MLNKNIFTILLIFISLITGFSVGIIFDRIDYLVLDPKVKAIEFLNLVLVILIALAVPAFLTRRLNDMRSKKTLVIEELKEFSKSLMAVAQELSDLDVCKPIDTVMLRQKTLFFKTLRSTLWLVCNEMPKNRDLNTKDVCFADLDKYWRYVTGTNGIGGTPEQGFSQTQKRMAMKLQLKAKKLMYEVNDL